MFTSADKENRISFFSPDKFLNISKLDDICLYAAKVYSVN